MRMEPAKVAKKPPAGRASAQADRLAAVQRLRALQAELAAKHGPFEDSVTILAKTRERHDGR